MSSKGVAPPNGAATLYKPTGLRPGGSAPPQRRSYALGVAPPNGAATLWGFRPPTAGTTFCRPTGGKPPTTESPRHKKNRGRQPSELTGEAATERSRGE